MCVHRRRTINYESLAEHHGPGLRLHIHFFRTFYGLFQFRSRKAALSPAFPSQMDPEFIKMDPSYNYFGFIRFLALVTAL